MSSFDKNISLGLGLSILAEGISGGKEAEILQAAQVLELVLEKGYVSRRWEALVTAIEALSFDSIAENYRAKRPYSKLLDIQTAIPVEHAFFESEQLARSFTKSIAYFGLRNVNQL